MVLGFCESNACSELFKQAGKQIMNVGEKMQLEFLYE